MSEVDARTWLLISPIHVSRHPFDRERDATVQPAQWTCSQLRLAYDLPPRHHHHLHGPPPILDLYLYQPLVCGAPHYWAALRVTHHHLVAPYLVRLVTNLGKMGESCQQQAQQDLYDL
ncbi:hypothetical protein PIB30_053731 [Stylosanthes scabra]|uniref:Uncharacterized protein n=1 Tax=Stylosanthes scabra TaxID=79078 RepID=A0ABU6VGR7_9FABA|nr:hypothetical protein [Stylosanthes scabra]